MKRETKNRHFAQGLGALVLASGLLLTGTGCKKQTASNQPGPVPEQTQPAPRSDQEIANDIQSRINAESALAGQNIQVAVTDGVATLNGAVNNDAARALTSSEAGRVNGVKTVINNLTVAPAQTAATQPAPSPTPRRERERTSRHRRDSALPESSQTAMAPAPPPVPPQPYQEPVRTVPATPPPPPAPVAKNVTIPNGATLPIRITDALDSGETQPGQSFHGTLANDLIADGMVAVPRGASVSGRVVDAKDAAHFSGSALLSIELTSVSVNGRQIPVVTNPYVTQGKGRGKNTAEKAGGGAALGAIIGALAGGGKGAAIGAASGGGIGAGVNGVTRGQQVKIPSETIVNFQLQSPINVSTTRSASQPAEYSDSGSPQLQPR